jgi:hypothetical protein
MSFHGSASVTNAQEPNAPSLALQLLDTARDIWKSANRNRAKNLPMGIEFGVQTIRARSLDARVLRRKITAVSPTALAAS